MGKEKDADLRGIFCIETSKFLDCFNIAVAKKDHLTGHSNYMNPNIDDSTCTDCIGTNCGMGCTKNTEYFIESVTIKKGVNPLYNMLKKNGCSIIPDYTTLKKWETDIDEWLADPKPNDLLLSFIIDIQGKHKEYYYNFYKFTLDDIRADLLEPVYIANVNGEDLIFESNDAAKSIARTLSIKDINTDLKINHYNKSIFKGSVESIK